MAAGTICLYANRHAACITSGAYLSSELHYFAEAHFVLPGKKYATGMRDCLSFDSVI